jgi:hypothetical protein
MKTGFFLYPLEKNTIASPKTTLPEIEEIKMEYLEYLVESRIRNAPCYRGIQDISISTMGLRIGLEGGPPPLFVVGKRSFVCH